MRTYTLLFSIAAHVAVVLVALVVTLTANDVLPEPRRTTELVVVRPVLPRASAAAVHRSAPRSQPAPAVSPNAAPRVAPDSVRPETGIESLPDPGAVRDGAVGILGGEPLPLEPLPPPLPTPVPPVRVGSGIRPPQKVHHVAPIYPPIAQAVRLGGVVILEAVIKEDGSVANVRVLRSIPMLDQAAVDAVQQWRFTPTLLNGQPVPVIMTVTVSFTPAVH